MKAHYLGHVVFYVKDLKRSLAFYRDLLGFKEVGRIFNNKAAALTSGRTHHELLLIEVGDAPRAPAGRRLGLYHIGIKVGDSLNELRAAKKELEDAGLGITGMSDHTGSQSRRGSRRRRFNGSAVRSSIFGVKLRSEWVWRVNARI
jgi:catechol 2,3-dioxygenase